MTNWTGTTATGNKSDSDHGEPITKGSLPTQIARKSLAGRFATIDRQDLDAKEDSESLVDDVVEAGPQGHREYTT